jgi:D-serine deaminase-like pyridoxal phosphate-dependent protein
VDSAIAPAKLITSANRSSSRASRSIQATCESRSISKHLKLEELSNSLRSAIDTFDQAGLHPGSVSGGSTPTLWHTHELDGVTEFRPGTYVYNDRTTAEIGACDWDDCALTVLATVVSTAVPGQAVIDAGSKSLGREPRAAQTRGGSGVCAGRNEVSVKSMSEEHSILTFTNGGDRRRRVA